MANENPSRQFNLSLRIDSKQVNRWLKYLGGGLLMSLVMTKIAWTVLGNLWLKLPMLALGIVLSLFFLLLVKYLLRLRLTSQNKLDIAENGLVDSVSFCPLGVVHMAQIERIRLVQKWDTKFIMVQFVRNGNPIRRSKRIEAAFYRTVIGDKLWVPVQLLKVSPMDLQSQFIHLNQLMNKPKSPPKLLLDQPIEAPQPVEIETEDSTEIGYDSSGEFESSALQSESARVRERVKEIRESIRRTGFDSLVALLYVDYLAQLPALADSSPDLVPAGIANIVATAEGADYEEMAFDYGGMRLQFGLRRDIGRSDQALLSIGVEGSIHMSLRVKVEIGVLDPVDVESFIAGPWQEQMGNLKKHFEEHEDIKLGRRPDGEPEEVINAPSKTNVQDLKSRFGIDED